MKTKAARINGAIDVCKSILVLLAVVLSYFLLQAFVSWLFEAIDVQMSQAALRIVSVAVWLAGAIAVSLVRKKNFAVEYRLLFKKHGRSVWIIPISAMLAFLMGVAMNNIVGFFVNALPTPESWITANSEAVAEASKGGMAAVFVALYVAAPLAEELVFRGKGFESVRSSCGFVWAVVITSLLFAVAHGNVLQGIYAFIAGVVFSIIIEKTGSLLTGVFAHAGFNISAALLSVISEGSRIDNKFVTLGCFVVFAASLTGIIMAGSFLPSEESVENEADDEEFDGYDSLE